MDWTQRSSAGSLPLSSACAGTITQFKPSARCGCGAGRAYPLTGQSGPVRPSTFFRTEARMERAQRLGVRQPFPRTSTGAPGFSDAGIDFDALRDPLGQAQTAGTSDGLHTREKVRRGGPLEEHQVVTHMLRALQIVRPTDASATNAAQTWWLSSSTPFTSRPAAI